jgi:hypothetical protein
MASLLPVGSISDPSFHVMGSVFNEPVFKWDTFPSGQSSYKVRFQRASLHVGHVFNVPVSERFKHVEKRAPQILPETSTV